MTKLTTCLLLLLAGAACAGTIVDVQTGVYAPGDVVTVNSAVVTGVLDDGLFIAEDPVVVGSGIFVHTGSAPTATLGDLAHVKGVYTESGGMSVLDVPSDPSGYLQIPGTHLGEIFPVELTMADILADGALYEGGYVEVAEGMSVTAAPDAQGVWTMGSLESPGDELVLRGAWYDAGTVSLGDCATCARGILVIEDGGFRLLPHEDGVCHIQCTVGNEGLGLGALKAQYR